MKKFMILVMVTILVTVLGVGLKLYVIGEPVDGKQLRYQVSVGEGNLELQVASVEPSVALRAWKIVQEEDTVYVSCRKVLRIPFGNYRDYKTDISVEAAERVVLGGVEIWSDAQMAMLLEDMEALLQMDMTNVSVQFSDTLEYIAKEDGALAVSEEDNGGVAVVNVTFECDKGVFEAYVDVESMSIITYMG